MESLLSALPLLACPIGMGLMMWLMMRGNRGQQSGSPPMAAGDTPASRTTGVVSQDDRLSLLRAQLGEVQDQQAAIAAQIARLSAEDQSARPPAPLDGAVARGSAAPGRGRRRQPGRTSAPEPSSRRLKR